MRKVGILRAPVEFVWVRDAGFDQAALREPAGRRHCSLDSYQEILRTRREDHYITLSTARAMQEPKLAGGLLAAFNSSVWRCLHVYSGVGTIQTALLHVG